MSTTGQAGLHSRHFCMMPELFHGGTHQCLGSLILSGIFSLLSNNLVTAGSLPQMRKSNTPPIFILNRQVRQSPKLPVYSLEMTHGSCTASEQSCLREPRPVTTCNGLTESVLDYTSVPLTGKNIMVHTQCTSVITSNLCQTP